VLGFICTVDLFPVPDSFAPSQSYGSRAGNATSSNVPRTLLFASSPPSSTSSKQSCEEHSPFRTQSILDWRSISSAEWQSTDAPVINDLFPSPASTEIVHLLGNYPITESSKRTQALVGATFVQADMLEYQGKKAILFPFSVGILFSILVIRLTTLLGSVREK
jgi:hypothetical protein